MRLFLLAHDKMREIGLSIINEESVELSHNLFKIVSRFRAYKS